MMKPKGIIVAMATPFNEDETINEIELRNQVNRHIGAGIHGLFCLGTNGEFFALTFEEKEEVMRIVVDENKGRLPVYAGTGCITTKETIALTQRAKELGVDCVSIISPYFAESSQESLYKHFESVALAVDIPQILYNIPARTGANLTYQTVQKLSKLENIVGVKDSSGNFDNILRYIEETEDFAVLSGNDSLILWTLMAGGTGGISGIANIFPETMANIYDFWERGDFEASKKNQDSIRAIRDCLKLGNPNSIVKRAASLSGQNLGPARAPFNVKDDKVDAKILETLELYK